MVHALRGENFGVFDGGHRPYGTFFNYQESRSRPRLPHFLSLPSSLERLALLALEAGTKESRFRAKAMKTRPPLRFCRHPSFWLGLLFACFLAWVWWDSYRIGSVCQLGWRNQMLTFANNEGEAFVAFKRYPGSRLEVNGSREASETVKAFQSEEWAWGSTLCRVPNALVFFSFLGLWVGWLAWRWKRE